MRVLAKEIDNEFSISKKLNRKEMKQAAKKKKDESPGKDDGAENEEVEVSNSNVKNRKFLSNQIAEFANEVATSSKDFIMYTINGDEEYLKNEKQSV